jgi:hypothetical protein
MKAKKGRGRGWKKGKGKEEGWKATTVKSFRMLGMYVKWQECTYGICGLFEAIQEGDDEIMRREEMR